MRPTLVQPMVPTGLDVAILETARGGILLRGLAYESNDVSVFTNVSPITTEMAEMPTV